MFCGNYLLSEPCSKIFYFKFSSRFVIKMSQHNHRSQLECLRTCLPDFFPIENFLNFHPNFTSPEGQNFNPKNFASKFYPGKISTKKSGLTILKFFENFFRKKSSKKFCIKLSVILSFLIRPARYFRYSL